MIAAFYSAKTKLTSEHQYLDLGNGYYVYIRGVLLPNEDCLDQALDKAGEETLTKSHDPHTKFKVIPVERENVTVASYLR